MVKDTVAAHLAGPDALFRLPPALVADDDAGRPLQEGPPLELGFPTELDRQFDEIPKDDTCSCFDGLGFGPGRLGPRLHAGGLPPADRRERELVLRGRLIRL